MTQILRDAGFGLRLLRRNPGSTLVAVLTLALGIGATTAMFSVIYATWIAPLPYRDAQRLVMVWSRFEGRRESVSQADFIDWKRRATVFEDLNAWNGRDVNLSVDRAAPRRTRVVGLPHHARLRTPARARPLFRRRGRHAGTRPRRGPDAPALAAALRR